MSVYVDNTPYGALRSRKSISIPLAAGQHHILVETSRGKSGMTTVDISPQAPMTVTIGLSQLTGGVKFS
ncbi:hypothetical protein [Arthrobacter cryoconiti]|uniref:PEGA domain-containing protein n=1 Tax=Arthrobacter cryoconiti TaxID=748907 RepID=A0ABV8R390_9MICC|nr:hypothetical protein [Arthrobacter cryoconiti]MCC9069823.1 hypothetical protein [Arthrobacter cryoconiti]